MNRHTLATSVDTLRQLVDQAFIYAYPLFVVDQTRQADLADPDPARRLQLNQLRHDRDLCDHTTRWITTPNNDTLYSRAWLDLSQGPVTIEVGRMPAGRYWSIALLDAFTNNFAMLGSRLDGEGPLRVQVVGPHHQGELPEGRVIRAPGDDVWLFGRFIVDGPADRPNAHAMQDQVRLQAATVAGAVGAAARAPVAAADAPAFLSIVNAALARNPAPPADAALLERLAAVGIRTDDPAGEAWSSLDPVIREAWQLQWADSQIGLRHSLRDDIRVVDGWQVRPDALGNFGTHYRLRAGIALGGLGALEPIEAVYASRREDQAGQPLDGTSCYRMRIAADGLPTDSFWSLSMYERLPDGRLFFTDNALQRYSIGDRTAGLHRAEDGSLEIVIQHAAPDHPDDRANWLPAPVGGFVLTLRAYLPRPELRQWQATLPAVSLS